MPLISIAGRQTIAVKGPSTPALVYPDKRRTWMTGFPEGFLSNCWVLSLCFPHVLFLIIKSSWTPFRNICCPGTVIYTLWYVLQLRFINWFTNVTESHLNRGWQFLLSWRSSSFFTPRILFSLGFKTSSRSWEFTWTFHVHNSFLFLMETQVSKSNGSYFSS